MEPLHTDWREGFLFVGNHTVLDLLNTKPVMDGIPQELLPDWQATVRWFQAAGMLEGARARPFAKKWEGTRTAETFVEELRQFREELRKVVIDLEAGKTIPRRSVEELNRLLKMHRTYAILSERDGRLQRAESFDSKRPQDLFSPLVRAACELLVNMDFSRLRQCEHCILHFYDTSKNATRRWCSMNLCGNRAKVAAYAQRQRGRTLASS